MAIRTAIRNQQGFITKLGLAQGYSVVVIHKNKSMRLQAKTPRGYMITMLDLGPKACVRLTFPCKTLQVAKLLLLSCVGHRLGKYLFSQYFRESQYHRETLRNNIWATIKPRLTPEQNKILDEMSGSRRLKKGYRFFSLVCHPDRSKKPSDVDLFKKVNDMMACLKLDDIKLLTQCKQYVLS